MVRELMAAGEREEGEKTLRTRTWPLETDVPRHTHGDALGLDRSAPSDTGQRRRAPDPIRRCLDHPAPVTRVVYVPPPCILCRVCARVLCPVIVPPLTVQIEKRDHGYQLAREALERKKQLMEMIPDVTNVGTISDFMFKAGVQARPTPHPSPCKRSIHAALRHAPSARV